MQGYIYKITNDVNDKVYIGKTVTSLKQRFAEHCSDSKNRLTENRPLHRAMNKYGINKFHIELVEQCDIQILSEREIYWIEHYHSYSSGYNATFGGDGAVLYDYAYINSLYDKGFLCKEIAELLHCDEGTVGRALKINSENSSTNAINRTKKPIKAIFKDGSTIIFDSIAEAAKWLQKNNYTSATAIKGIVANIGRVAVGKDNRKTYLKIKWEFINGE